MAIAVSTFATFFIPMSNFQQKLLSVGILVFVIIMNIISTKYGGIIQTISTVGKLIPIVAIIVFGLMSGEVHFYNRNRYSSSWSSDILLFEKKTLIVWSESDIVTQNAKKD